VSDQVDILFANEGEAMALYDVDTVEAVLEHVKADVEIAAVTCGPKGSLVVHDGEVIPIPAHPADRVVDTTGAGDLYAAGFLYGYTAGKPLEACGRLGSMAATAVLGHTGPRPGLSLAQLASSSGL
jgi:sugar/nucleoside kinase (ribokinase family)